MIRKITIWAGVFAHFCDHSVMIRKWWIWAGEYEQVFDHLCDHSDSDAENTTSFTCVRNSSSYSKQVFCKTWRKTYWYFDSPPFARADGSKYKMRFVFFYFWLDLPIDCIDDNRIWIPFLLQSGKDSLSFLSTHLRVKKFAFKCKNWRFVIPFVCLSVSWKIFMLIPARV